MNTLCQALCQMLCVCVCVVGGGEGTEQNPCPLEANILVMAF